MFIGGLKMCCNSSTKIAMSGGLENPPPPPIPPLSLKTMGVPLAADEFQEYICKV